MAQQCVDYRLGDTAATMVPLLWREIPIPVSSPYSPYAIAKVCGDMRVKGFGFPVVSWVWTRLSQAQVYNILELFAHDTDASADVYMRTYKDVGTIREVADFTAIMYRPLDGNGKTLVPSSRFWHTNIAINFRRLIEV